MNNNRGQNQSHQRKLEGVMFTNPNQFTHSGVQASNSSAYLLGGPRAPPRHYVNPAPHNVSEMKNNHMAGMAHGQIQMLPHISQRQQGVYLPSYPGSSNHAYFPYPQQTSQTTVIMPYLPNYPTNQSGVYYSAPPRPLQMANIPQGPQNSPVANMSNAQNSHGTSLIVQSQPMEMTTNSQPLQVPQQPSTTPMQIPDPRPLRRKNLAIKIINPDTGEEISFNNTSQALPSADELEKMKVQSQFQSQVQSVVKKDDTKVSDNNQNNEGGEKVRNEFQTRVKKLLSEQSLTPSKETEVDEAQLPEETLSKTEEISVVTTSIEEVPVTTSDSTLAVGLTVGSEEVLDVNESDKETPTNSLPNSTPTHEEPIVNTDTITSITGISEDSINAKKIVEEESLKPVKSKKNKAKKKKDQQKNSVKLDTNDGVKVDNVIETIVEPVVVETITQENKENENDSNISKSEEEENNVQKTEDIPQQPQETQNNGMQHEPEEDNTPKLPSYLENLPYAEGQWSATNPTGKKVYSKLFLIKLGSEPVCQKKPDILLCWSHITKSNSPQNSPSGVRTGMSNLSSRSLNHQSAVTGFMPGFFKPGNSQHRMVPTQTGAKRNTSQGKAASKAKPNTIHMSLSLREEVKLHQTESAWVPTAAKKASKAAEPAKAKNEEEMKTDEVYKNVRSILNKITPDNMVPLTELFKALPINTMDRLEKTIDLVFEKAIEEQSFAPLYASLCSAMQFVQVSCGEGDKMISFKKLIISKCQSLFEQDKVQENDSAIKLSEINSCKDPEKKKELQLVYEENERRLRKRSVGNCRFIGELFKQKILTSNIMLYCIVHLVTKLQEEPLECLCNLLKTVGKELDQSFNLNETFEKLKALTSKEMKSKIPSRIRFMIQDVIDLRKDKWIPRRIDSKPKLINEIENDAKNEAIEQSMAQSYRPEKRDHHRGDDKFRGGDNKIRRGNEGEWNVVNTAKFKQNYTIDQSKLQGFKDSSAVVKLGPSSKWSFPISSGSNNSSFTSNNTFSVLDDKKSTPSQTMSSRNTSRKPLISESEEKQRMLAGIASITPQFAQKTPSLKSTNLPNVPKEIIDEPNVVELDPKVADIINLKCKNIIQEYEQMHNLEDIIYSLAEEEKSEIRTRHEEFVKSMCLITLDSSPNSRTEAGKIFAELLSKKVISMAAITQGIDGVLKDWNDYLMDYPQLFSYIAAIITPLLISKTASFEFCNLKDACISIRPDNSSIFFTEVLQKILSSKETQNIKEEVGGILWIYNKWRMSENVTLDAFMPNNQINKYFKNDRVGVFLLSIAMYDKMRLTDSKQLCDVMLNWLNTNINAEIIKCPHFVRALTIAIVIVCLKSNRSFEDFFDNDHVKLLTLYIRSEPLPEPEIQAREVQCLYGIQIMSAAEEHPAGMVLKLFHKLYQDSVISKESFEIWKKEDEFKAGFDEDQETKTMAVVVLNSFFLSLATNDSDDDDEEADQ